MKNPHALIIGIDSNIGKALSIRLRFQGWEVFGTTRRTEHTNTNNFYVDLLKEQTIQNISGSFDVIYACAAITNMAFCENNPEISRQVNYNAQTALARHCINKTKSYVFLSTTGVFDGSEPKRSLNASTNSKCQYGKHKAETEQFLLNFSDKVTVVRTSKVITYDNKLITDWITALNANQEIYPFCDMTLSPVPIDQLIELLINISLRKTNKIVHISGNTDILYCELATILAKKLNKPLSLIKTKSYTESGLDPITVLPFSSLDMTETMKSYDLKPSEITDIVAMFPNIKISIVIPNYNHARYLPTALDHALQQIVPAHEIIVIDDGSTDNSLAIINSYQKKYADIKLLKNSKNMGVNYTLNRGLHEATGSHVVFAAADDWMEPTFLQYATYLLKNNPTAGLVSGACWIVHENKLEHRLVARMPYPIPNDGYISSHRVRNLLNKLDSWFAGNTVTMNRQYAVQEGGFNAELQSFTDNFLYRVLASKYGCCFTHQKIATWRICSNSFAKSFNDDATRQLNVLKSTIDIMRNKHSDIFSASTIYKVQQRISFSLARTIWINHAGKSSTELENFLNATFKNKFKTHIAKIALRITSMVPKLNRKLGNLVLFMFIRPFDIWQQVSMFNLLR